MMGPKDAMRVTSGTTYLSYIFLVTSAVAYFIPSFIAWKRKANRLIWIFTLNLFTGWTALGWMAALIWAIEVAARTDSSQFMR